MSAHLTQGMLLTSSEAVEQMDPNRSGPDFHVEFEATDPWVKDDSAPDSAEIDAKGLEESLSCLALKVDLRPTNQDPISEYALFLLSVCVSKLVASWKLRELLPLSVSDEAHLMF